MNLKRFIDSFNNAVTGILTAIRSESNLRAQFIIAIIVLVLSLFYNFSRMEFLILLFAISSVIIAEMFNTVAEKVVDMITKDFHPLARIIKDMAAGAVLIAALNAMIVGYLLFFDRINPFTSWIIFKIGNSPIHLTFIALVLVVLLTIAFKGIFFRGKGTHFQGGTVSGHSALGFCIASIISLISNNFLLTSLAFVLAFLVAESRVEGKIHSVFEVIMGALLGTVVGVLVFQLLN